MSRKGISPLLATTLLIAFSVFLGAVVMSWGEKYVEERAEFVQGVQEIRTGCDSVSFSIVEIRGDKQICEEDGRIKMTIENGPKIALDGLKANIIGKDGVKNIENVLENGLDRTSIQAIQIRADAGNIRQLRLTPSIRIGGDKVFCADQAKTYDNVPKCAP